MTRPVHGGNLAWAAQLAGCAPSLILDFSASISPLGPPQSAIAAIQEGLGLLKAYPDPSYTQLRLALAQHHQLPPEWILPGNGAAELLTWAGWDLKEQLVTCLVTPAFGDYWRALRAVKAQIIPYPLSLEDGRLPVWGGVVGERKNWGVLLNNPHNPTGKLFSQKSILSAVEEFALVVVDEAFMDFVPPNKQQSLIELVTDYPNLVILRSLTKFYSLPGLRLGYAIAHPERLQRWQSWRDPWAVNILAAEAGIAAVQDYEFQQQTWNWLPSAREKLYQGLASLPGIKPYESAANFLLVATDIPSSQLQLQLLQKEKILIRDCLSFPELGDSYFRVAIRTETDNQRLVASLARVLGV